MTITILAAAAAEAALDELADVLHDCVAQGASVNFIQPFPPSAARDFWHRQLPTLRNGKAVLFVARQAGGIVGTVMLGLDTPPNQPHRADVKKLLVHSRARRQGIARALMQAAETEARQRGLRLLTLDTRHGDSAEPLYHQLGYTLLGIVPGYSLPVAGGPAEACAFFYKTLT